MVANCPKYEVDEAEFPHHTREEQDEHDIGFGEGNVGGLFKCYYLFHGKQYCYLDLNGAAMKRLFRDGYYICEGRWYWPA
jgi:hypothetical protein